MSQNSIIHNWLVTGGSSHEGRQFLLNILEDESLKAIFSKNLKHQDQIIRTALAQRNGFKKPKEPKLRDDFPFLREPNCPFELKILAADKITAHSKYKEAHVALFDCTSTESQYLTAKLLVENFIDNQLIWKELEYYKQNKTILGKHPVFKELNRIKDLRKSSPVELVEQKTRIIENIWRIESEIKKGNKPHLQVEREKRLQLRKNELAEIERLIESYR